MATEVQCDQCGKPVTKRERDLRRHRSHFCDKGCFDAWQRGEQRVVSDPPPASAQDDLPSLYQVHKKKYEEWLQLPASSAQATPAQSDVSIIISDLHIPDERWDLLAEIVRRYGGYGLPLYIAGDLFDWENFSRYDSLDLRPPGVDAVLSRGEVVLELLTKAFTIYFIEGNHDRRPFKRAMRALGPGMAWLTQEFLKYVYRDRYGVQLIERPVVTSGEVVSFCHQLGDVVIGHIERGGGRQAAFGAREAHGFYSRFAKDLGISEFSGVLQAHTHKTSVSRHPDTRKVLVEIGCMCRNPSYAIHSHRYLASECGYFVLHQKNGVTDWNESRLHVLD